ncbi:aminotransferase-like domain-containing protein [Burkholderia sp. Ac-20379]|uniref:aminotransferase-like domain-containing protein n=1 Tax=Burkholderia sp. Ac-20379 TaxID=2703900 RepID=UPI00197F57B4|nr:PLP-dependent aminotransferase family protein [Burkholderia sp. Ac-20379]MBN3724367.1 PLP-dependent aminotransferase family protein [Burkholderia sp. Ac-20379]
MTGKYRAIAEHYIQAIERGALADGQRLPSLRALAELHRVSLATSIEACRLLEKQGYAQARPRAGYFVRHPDRRKPEPAAPEQSSPQHGAPAIDPADYVGVHERISVMLATAHRHPPSVDLGRAICAPSMYPGAALREHALRILRSAPTLYDASPDTGGVHKLKTAIARLSVARGLGVEPDSLLVTHGCSEALSLALRAVTKPGDIVAIESPCYFGILQIIESLGLRAVEIPTDPRTGLSLDGLDIAMNRPEGVRAVLCSPSIHNPLGGTMPDTAKARLVAMCEQRGVALIEDDSYGAFLSNPASARPLKAWDTGGNVIYCSTLNKSLSPGARIGWVIGGKWQNRIAMMMYAVSRHREEVPQLAVADYLANGAFLRHMRRMQTQLARQRALLADAVERHFPAGTEVTRPEAGLLLWVALPGKRDVDRLFSLALDAGIRISPGSMFSNTGRFDHCLRLGAGMPFDTRVAAAVERLGQLIATLPS